MAFYKFFRDDRSIEPVGITAEPSLTVDAAPLDWWNYNILEEDGAAKFRESVRDVKDMSRQIDHACTAVAHKPWNELIPVAHEPWGDLVVRSFSVAEDTTGSPELYIGSWNRLLHSFFSPETAFEIDPQSPLSAIKEVADYIVQLVVYMDLIPVLILQLKLPADLRFSSKRREADDQLRRRLGLQSSAS